MTIVYILGSGHCGSTLLDMLLNGHSQIQGLGEAGRKTAPPSLMNMFAIRLKLNKKLRQVNYASNHLKYIKCISRITGKTILVDSSKFWQRLYLLSQESSKIKVIHLVRDGRGVSYSYDKKYGRFFYGLRRWMAPTFMAILLKTRFRKTDWVQLRYETLSASPEASLKKLCSFLEIEFEPAMLDFRKHSYTGIGGNRMKDLKSAEIKTDQAWKKDMPLGKKLLFSLIGGWLNRYFGYPFFQNSFFKTAFRRKRP